MVFPRFKIVQMIPNCAKLICYMNTAEMQAAYYFRIKLHLRRLAEFWIRLCTEDTNVNIFCITHLKFAENNWGRKFILELQT